MLMLPVTSSPARNCAWQSTTMSADAAILATLAAKGADLAELKRLSVSDRRAFTAALLKHVATHIRARLWFGAGTAIISQHMLEIAFEEKEGATPLGDGAAVPLLGTHGAAAGF